MGSESSDDPAGSEKTFGDVWVARFDNPGGVGGNTINDGKRYLGSEVIAKGSSAPNLLGVFQDKTAIEADRTGGRCDGNVYFAWARVTGVGISNIYFARSVDHGATWSKPKLLTQRQGNLQDPDISVTGNGHIYVTYDVAERNNGQPNGVEIAKSIDCGETFGPSALVTEYIPYNAQDLTVSGGSRARLRRLRQPLPVGYTFFRRGTSTRSTADQYDAAREWIYIVYEATIRGTEVDTGTTYGSIEPGLGSQSGAFFLRYDGATGAHTDPKLIAPQSLGHQVSPDISADGGVLHTIWWDSRNDPCYSATRPLGNCADRKTVPSLDVFGSSSTDHGTTWAPATQLNDVRSNEL
ncbi:MAG: glycoside hydrolase [Pseudomonadota bacterium]|nr:glycoside hydrolase [Pseudomonadota bacterium]